MGITCALNGTSNRAWLSVGALPCRPTQSDLDHMPRFWDENQNIKYR